MFYKWGRFLMHSLLLIIVLLVAACHQDTKLPPQNKVSDSLQHDSPTVQQYMSTNPGQSYHYMIISGGRNGEFWLVPENSEKPNDTGILNLRIKE